MVGRPSRRGGGRRRHCARGRRRGRIAGRQAPRGRGDWQSEGSRGVDVAIDDKASALASFFVVLLGHANAPRSGRHFALPGRRELCAGDSGGGGGRGGGRGGGIGGGRSRALGKQRASGLGVPQRLKCPAALRSRPVRIAGMQGRVA